MKPPTSRPFRGGAQAALAALLLGGASACSAQSAARSHAVEIRAFRFVPDTVTVAVGDTLVWRNHDVVPHTATAGSRRWDSGNLAAGAEWRRVADQPGAEEYVCAYHPTMRAVVVVRARG